MKIHIWFNYLLVSQRAQSLTYVKVGPDSRIVISINKNSNKFMYTGKFDIIKCYEDPGQWQTQGFRTFNLETLWIPSFPYVCLKPFSNTRMSRFQAFHNCLKPLEDKNDDLNVNHILYQWYNCTCVCAHMFSKNTVSYSACKSVMGMGYNHPRNLIIHLDSLLMDSSFELQLLRKMSWHKNSLNSCQYFAKCIKINTN